MALSLSDLLPLLARISAERDHTMPLAELAAQAGRSPSHFQRAFSRLVAESPKQFEKRLRLECAAALLLTTRDSILDIALRIGFESHEGFTRAFVAHFGRTPRAFRKRAASESPQTRELHARSILHVGPCVGLFRTSLSPPTVEPPGRETMSYDITQKRLQSQTVLFRKEQCELADIAKALGEALPSVFRYATESGIALVGPPFTRYRSWGPALLSIEAGLAVAPGAQGSGDIEVGELEAGPAATTVHTGPYDGLGDAHAAVQRWIEANGLTAGVAPWEVYLTDPGEVPNPAEWKTEIVWPLAE